MNVDLNFALMIPELVLIGVAIAVLLLDVLVKGDEEGQGGPRSLLTGLGTLGALVALALVTTKLVGGVEAQTSFGGLFVVDSFAMFFKMIALVATVLSLLLSDTWLRQHRMGAGAYTALVLFAATGMLYVASAGDLVMLFLGIELMSIPIYILAAAERWKDRSVEAGVKYLVLGAFATAILLFGFALLYGFVGISTGTASTSLSAIRDAVVSARELPVYAILGGTLVLVGLLFKISAAPFHMWTPDVYEGAPTSVTAYMSVAVKAVTAAILLRIFGGSVLETLQLSSIVAVVAVLTMLVGNTMALVQDNVKRMLAYSSIAHGGYMLVGLLAGTSEGYGGILFYALSYTVTNIAAFGVLIWLSRRGHEVERFDDLRGLGGRFPLVGAVMAIAMLSLMGIPPFAVFFGKFMIFRAAIAEGWYAVTVIGLLTSAVSVGYYLRPIVTMFMGEAKDDSYEPGGRGLHLGLGMTITAVAVVLLGVFAEGPLQMAVESVKGLVG